MSQQLLFITFPKKLPKKPLRHRGDLPLFSHIRMRENPADPTQKHFLSSGPPSASIPLSKTHCSRAPTKHRWCSGHSGHGGNARTPPCPPGAPVNGAPSGSRTGVPPWPPAPRIGVQPGAGTACSQMGLRVCGAHGSSEVPPGPAGPSVWVTAATHSSWLLSSPAWTACLRCVPHARGLSSGAARAGLEPPRARLLARQVVDAGWSLKPHVAPCVILVPHSVAPGPHGEVLTGRELVEACPQKPRSTPPATAPRWTERAPASELRPGCCPQQDTCPTKNRYYTDPGQKAQKQGSAPSGTHRVHQRGPRTHVPALS